MFRVMRLIIRHWALESKTDEKIFNTSSKLFKKSASFLLKQWQGVHLKTVQSSCLWCRSPQNATMKQVTNIKSANVLN